MKIAFDSNLHCYAINDIPVPGCTQITGLLPKGWMAPWAAKECAEYIKNELMKLSETPEKMTLKYVLSIVAEGKGAYRRKATKAADSGTVAHDWIDRFIQFRLGKGERPEDQVKDLSAANSIKLFLDWESAEKPQWVSSEIVVGSEKYMVAGKYDWTARFPEHGLVLGDNKTSSKIFDEMNVQINGGYRLMHDEMNPQEPIDKTMILWIPKTGDKFEARIIPTHYEADRGLFLALLNLYKAIKNREKSNE